MNTAAAAAPSLDVIDELDWWALKQAAMRAAVELDMFTAIAAGHDTLEAIAAAIGASRRAALLMAIELVHDAADSEVYTFAEYKAFLAAAGFVEVTQHSNRLIGARKPADG